MSRWERGTVYPTWQYWPRVVDYLGYDPFTDPALGHPGGNKPQGVAFLTSGTSGNLGRQIVAEGIKGRMTRKQFAQKLGLSPKTVWNWQT